MGKRRTHAYIRPLKTIDSKTNANNVCELNLAQVKKQNTFKKNPRERKKKTMNRIDYMPQITILAAVSAVRCGATALLTKRIQSSN